MSLKGNKNRYYELNFWQSKINIQKVLLSIFALLGSVVVSLGDAQAFFISDDSPIPKNWTLFKNKNNARIIAILFITIPFITLILSDETLKENKDIYEIAYDVTLPYLEEDIRKFCEATQFKFKLSSEIRMYIMLPIRQSWHRWELKIVASTQNVDNRERNLSLELDEGLIGYHFYEVINENSKNTTICFPVPDIHNLPPGYKHLRKVNQSLVKGDNKAFVLFPIFDKDFLVGMFVIDTNNPSDVPLLAKSDLHADVFNWIGNEPKFITLVWRLKNNGS